MNFAGISRNISKIVGRGGLAVKNVSPELCLGIGVVGILGATVLVYKATLKVELVKADHQEKLDKIHDMKQLVDDGEVPEEEYSIKDYKKDLTLAYTQTTLQFTKLYLPAITTMAISLALIVWGHKILKTRNAALIAAYKTLEKGFVAYRKRVVEEYGEEKDYMYKNGIRAETVMETEVDENGKKHKVEKTNYIMDPNGLSVYSRFFDESNPQWQKDDGIYNKAFLQHQQSYWNDLLRARGHVFLNEVYDALGFPRTKEGAVVGWVMGKTGDNYIDFGLFDGERAPVRDFVNGYERSILLDFNVDGVIWDLFTKETD